MSRHNPSDGMTEASSVDGAVPDRGIVNPWRPSRESAYRVREHGADVLYFKRTTAGLFGDSNGPWEVVRQEGTARVNIYGPNAHRKVLASFAEEVDADAFLISKGARP